MFFFVIIINDILYYHYLLFPFFEGRGENSIIRDNHNSQVEKARAASRGQQVRFKRGRGVGPQVLGSTGCGSPIKPWARSTETGF